MIILFFGATYCLSLRDRLRCERRGRSSSIVTLTPSIRQRYGLASIVGSSHKKNHPPFDRKEEGNFRNHNWSDSGKLKIVSWQQFKRNKNQLFMVSILELIEFESAQQYKKVNRE